MTRWVITKNDSDREVGRWELPGNLSHPEIEKMLRFLAARDLSEIEVIDACRRKNDRRRNGLLDRVTPFQFGENPWYVASREDDEK